MSHILIEYKKAEFTVAEWPDHTMTLWRGETDTRHGREQRCLGGHVHQVQHSNHFNRAYKTLEQGKDKRH